MVRPAPGPHQPVADETRPAPVPAGTSPEAAQTVGGRRQDGVMTTTAPPRAPLSGFSAPVREWFVASFAEPTAAQAQAWESISSGDNTLVVAPTGSGKTLAAFLWAIDRLVSRPPPDD